MSSPATTASPRAALNLPEPLAPLGEVAFNLWWTWNSDAQALFRSVDPRLWEHGGHNPVHVLRKLSASRKHRLAEDTAFLAELREVRRRLRAYLSAPTWFKGHQGRKLRGQVAYFSMEFGLHESLPIYAGGLGILAGDHLKSVSDLGLPLVGVGVFWRHGYGRQHIDASGRQADSHDRLQPANLPLEPVVTASGRPVRIRIPMGPDTVTAVAWRLAVGRTSLLLLDTHLEENAPRHRELTNRLYIGDRDARIRQELLLGVGGWKLLKTVGLPIAACHLNEGHAAFCSLERVAETLRETRCDFPAAVRQVADTTIFTTHTPVPEGNEVFDPGLVEHYLRAYPRRLGIPSPKLLGLGRVNPQDEQERFGMTPLALRLASRANGVSELHGEVSRRMWSGLWPRRQPHRVPIGSITNGVHLRTWMHPRMAELLDEYLPARWEERQTRPGVWAKARRIRDARLWGLHQELKAELVEFVRTHVRRRLERNGASEARIKAASSLLDPEALTIGFARRFAPYKRALLMFTNPDRLDRIVNDTRRPVQFIFSGKPHPEDDFGKELVARFVKHADSPRFRQRIVFIEDNTIEVARHMVSGVDVWLNNPRRPQEASGTSGMKPALHGGLNLSILDGWWPEACKEGRNGWSIGQARDHDGSEAADRRDARALYRRLRRDVVPLYYDRDRHGRPAKWIRCMKHALATIPAEFNSHRMVAQYFRRYYLPVLAAKRR